MYREAKNSESDFYRFLCCYKLMEGLLGKMRADVVARAKAAGVSVQKERNVVPNDEHLAAELRAYVGTSMKAFFDQVLTARFRNAVAHFVTDDGIVLQMSSAAGLSAYASLALITDLCARELVASHERLLAQLPPR
jgi:2-hydroxychromene-2-carboxylate isomerase